MTSVKLLKKCLETLNEDTKILTTISSYPKWRGVEITFQVPGTNHIETRRFRFTADGEDLEGWDDLSTLGTPVQRQGQVQEDIRLQELDQSKSVCSADRERPSHIA